ncbi:TniQ family protein [uncultured Ruegeria sp.]|uniref:TniQ family protein n=1 Tax=uncultured Ruegeria sp. TaxID=259304 RepID=UPI002609DCDF|nr:TniQ family protein [uncultured Ruegeria sp.]
MGEARLEYSAPAHGRVRVTVNPLPRRPPPERDELLSSWIGRLARANHCSVEELCGYLGLGQGRVPERMKDLRQVNWARLSPAVQQTREDIAVMTLPDTMHLPVQYVSSDDFQRCANCASQTQGLVLRHWRFAWSLTCENCGRRLVAKHPSDGLSDRQRVRAARGAAVLKTAVQTNDLRRMRRISRTLAVLKIFGLEYPASFTSRCQLQRSEALAAVHVCATRPLLGAAVLMCGNDRAFWELRRAFPQHRQLIARVLKVSKDLEKRLPRQQKAEPTPTLETRAADRPVASEGALQAARQAISELGPDADRLLLLARADAIWKRQSCVRN